MTRQALLVLCCVGALGPFASFARSQVDLGLDWARGGHAGAIEGISLAPSGTRFVAGGHDGSVKRWSLATGQFVDTVGSHAGPVTDVSWSPAGTTIVSCDSLGTVRIWNLGGGPTVEISTGDEPLHALAHSADAQTIYAAGDSGTIHVISQGIVVDEIDASDAPIRTLAVSPDGSLLASGGDDTLLYLWRTSDGTLQHALSGHARAIRGARFSPDGEHVASHEACRTLVFRSSTGAVVKDYDWTTENVASVEFCSDTELLISTRTGRLRRRDLTTDQDLYAVDTGFSGGFLRCSDDGSTVVIGHENGALSQRNASDGSVIADLVGNGGPVFTTSISPDASKVCCNPGGVRVEVRSAVDGSLVSDNQPFGTPGGTSLEDLIVHQARFTSTASAYVGACEDGRLRFWRTQNGVLLTSIDAGHGAALCVDLSSDDSRVFAGFEDGSIVAFLTSGGVHDFTIAGHSDWTTALDASSDGAYLASGGRDGEVHVWNAGDGSLAVDLGSHEAGVETVRFAPDSGVVASGGNDGVVRIWNPFSGALLQSIVTGTDSIPALAFSPESDVLAISAAGELRFHDVATGANVTGEVPEAMWVTRIEWTSDVLALGRADGTVVVATVQP